MSSEATGELADASSDDNHEEDQVHSSLFYKQPFYKQPGSNSWKFKQFLSNCRGWNCLETKQSDAEAIPQESKGLNIFNTKE